MLQPNAIKNMKVSCSKLYFKLMFPLEVCFEFFFVYLAKDIKRKQYCEKSKADIVTATVASSSKHVFNFYFTL